VDGVDKKVTIKEVAQPKRNTSRKTQTLIQPNKPRVSKNVSSGEQNIVHVVTAETADTIDKLAQH
tara:strand:- start:6489 stop:6683 length:195 start_codon:yes stop_codon:yes gene_type:complete